MRGGDPVVLEALAEGEVEVLGRLPWSSNATLLAKVCHGTTELQAVYKPGRGERPLWDFPPPIYRREVAAWVLSQRLGWGLVPETIERDGPLGPGSLQRFVPVDHEQHYFTIAEDPAHHDQLRLLAAFDLVANQTDRKSGHVLVDDAGDVWAIDNGLSFHDDFKVRTVIWDFVGDPLPAAAVEALRHLVDEPLPDPLYGILVPAEIDALLERATALVEHPVLPEPPFGQHSFPWPLV